MDVVTMTMLSLCSGAPKDSSYLYEKISYRMQSLYHQAKKRDGVLPAPIEQQNNRDNRHTFTLQDVHNLCILALRNRIEVPFEVIGHKSFFAKILNTACTRNSENHKQYTLTNDDVGHLLRGNIPEVVRNKPEAIIAHAHERVQRKIARQELTTQIEWREQHYKYAINLALWEGSPAVFSKHVS